MHRQRGLMLLELLVAIGLLAILAAILLPALARTHEAARRVQCVNNLKEIGTAHRLFAAEHDGFWVPRLVPYHLAYSADLGCWSSFDGVFMYPNYIGDHRVLLCPSDIEYPRWQALETIIRPVDPSWRDAPEPNPVRHMTVYPVTADYSYVYWGYVVEPEHIDSPVSMQEFGKVLDSRVANGVNHLNRFRDLSLQLPGNEVEVQLRRLREGVERVFITDVNNPAAVARAAAELPVMWDTVRSEDGEISEEYNHIRGANVLFFDGHVEYAEYPQPGTSPFWMLSESACVDNIFHFP